VIVKLRCTARLTTSTFVRNTVSAVELAH